MVGAKCKVSFDVTNSLASVLGFEQNIVYGFGRHASENLFNIMIANPILVHCNIIHSSYMRGTQARVPHNFFPNAVPGQNIPEAPHFYLSSNDCRRHFHFVSVVNRSAQRALRFTWR